MPTERIGIGLAGCGVVGSAVADELLRRGPSLSTRCGVDLELRHVVVRDPRKPRPSEIPHALFRKDAEALLGDDKTHIVVELIGGLDDAEQLIRGALAAGKDVVTANKALLALRGASLFAAARQAGRCIAFEAAVAGGIPLIETVRRGLVANEIDAVFAILNGTCNDILTNMLARRISYAEALRDAQRLGFAEADPTLDVDGTDSAHKLAILASLAMRTACPFEAIDVHGITDIEVTDLVAGEELGFVCKLLAVARRHGDALDLSVRPTFIRKSHPLAAVAGPFNAISLYGHAAGHTLLYGRGAGGLPTASAVLADIVDVAVGNAARTFSHFAVLPDQTPPAVCRKAGENESPFYIRVGLEDRPGGMGKIATLLGHHGISIAALVQHEPRSDGAVPVLVTTRSAKDQTIRAAISEISALDRVIGRVVCIPIMEEHTESGETTVR